MSASQPLQTFALPRIVTQETIGEWLMISVIALGLAAIYCVARAVVDLREKRYIWGALGVASALALVLIPVPTHAIKVEIPAQS